MQSKTIGKLFSEYKAAKAEFNRAWAETPPPQNKFVVVSDWREEAAIVLTEAESKLRLRWLDTFGSPF